ncbi:unnamed protein product [Prunus armeniaca]
MSQKTVKTESSCYSLSKPESPSSIVPYPSFSPIPVVNRYSPLGTTVGQFRPNYQSALVSSYDPFQLSSTATPISSYPKSSPYVHKSSSNLFIIEPHIPEIMSPAMIAKEHFPSVNWETRTFSRQFSVKWWDRFEVPRIAEYAYRDFPQAPAPQLPKQKSSSSQSSQTSLSVEGKSKAKLQDIARQLMLQASQMNDDEDNESQSSSSCRPLSSSQKSHDCPLRWFDYPHGQDPNEDYPAYDLNSD